MESILKEQIVGSSVGMLFILSLFYCLDENMLLRKTIFVRPFILLIADDDFLGDDGGINLVASLFGDNRI